MTGDLDKNLEAIRSNDLNIIRWVSIFLLPFWIMAFNIFVINLLDNIFYLFIQKIELKGILRHIIGIGWLIIFLVGPSIAIVLTSDFSRFKKAVLVLVLSAVIMPSVNFLGILTTMSLHRSIIFKPAEWAR